MIIRCSIHKIKVIRINYKFKHVATSSGTPITIYIPVYTAILSSGEEIHFFFVRTSNCVVLPKIAITGGSNGGLLVGAVMTQRPELFKAAVPEVGLLDMIRYEKYGIAGVWHEEYGSINDSIEFTNLLSYSPLHNLKTGINYPATLVITSRNDDRVHPFHSYKFVAALQDIDKQNHHLLLVEEMAGHYGSTTLDGQRATNAMKFGFIFKHLGMK
ncbi:MAG: S9 family peptidase [Chitinophagales bacterium]|nr:S9 family peptidase [Chitinophagales bacterium]